MVVVLVGPCSSSWRLRWHDPRIASRVGATIGGRLGALGVECWLQSSSAALTSAKMWRALPRARTVSPRCSAWKRTGFPQWVFRIASAGSPAPGSGARPSGYFGALQPASARNSRAAQSTEAISVCRRSSGVVLVYPHACPHKWAVGTTFEWEFDFPVHPNPAYDHEPEPKGKKRQPAKPPAPRTPARKVSKPATIAAKPKASEKPKRVRLTPEERRERARARAVEKRSKLKEQGLCRDCQQPAIPGQTRCPDCAEKHRRLRGPR